VTQTGTTTTPTTNCTGSCVAPSCTTGSFGETCGSAPPPAPSATATLYQLTPVPNPSGYAAGVGKYANLHESGGVFQMTAANLIPNLTYYPTVADIPDQPWTLGFPGYPQLTEWFGMCYNGGWVAPATGSYTFVVEVDDGVAMWIDGKLIFDDEDGIISTTAVENNLGGDDPGAIMDMPPVTLTAGLHQVMIKYFNGWPVVLGLILWDIPPGQSFKSTGCSPELGGTCTTPPASDLMQLVAPPVGSVDACPGQ